MLTQLIRPNKDELIASHPNHKERGWHEALVPVLFWAGSTGSPGPWTRVGGAGRDWVVSALQAIPKLWRRVTAALLGKGRKAAILWNNDAARRRLAHPL